MDDHPLSRLIGLVPTEEVSKFAVAGTRVMRSGIEDTLDAFDADDEMGKFLV